MAMPRSIDVVERDPWTTAAKVESAALGRTMPVEAFVPLAASRGPGSVPIAFLFHGRGADETQWFEGHGGDGVGLDRLAHTLVADGTLPPLVIVSAAIDDSYGLDSSPAADGYDHGPYERYILDELMPTMEARYVGGVPSRRLVGGLSMGGETALRFAYQHPDLFERVAVASPALWLSSPPAERTWIYDPGNDPLRLVRTVNPLPPTFLGYGRDDYDWIRAGTTELAKRLTARGEPNEPLVVPGGHDVGTWRALARPLLLALVGS
ncbi:MAG TPA: alpha/beta hydrolase-fold protein [Candidatus Limnocylindrales bacterium]|nr:alpha/beta hydrolase-fold protein [Candidatus Limnocylindrales bacterium]